MTTQARWDALPQDTKDAILEKHRNWNVDNEEWWDGMYEFFTEDMKAIGVCVDKIYFSGFWSQGDGACFEGSVENWIMFLPSLYKDEELRKHIELFKTADEFTCEWEHRGHYYHSGCVAWNESYEFTVEDTDSPLRQAANKVLLGDRRDLAEAMSDTIREALRDHMNDLYKKLEEEHNYLTSDEAVLESLMANDRLESEIDEHEEEGDESESESAYLCDPACQRLGSEAAASLNQASASCAAPG